MCVCNNSNNNDIDNDDYILQLNELKIYGIYLLPPKLNESVHRLQTGDAEQENNFRIEIYM